MDITKADALVTGGNVTTPTISGQKKYHLAYLRGNGAGAKRIQELLLLAKEEGFVFEGSWQYNRKPWGTSITLFDFCWTAVEPAAKSLEDAMAQIIRSHRLDF